MIAYGIDYEVKGNKYKDVYDEQDIIKTSCDLVNGYGVDPDDIEVVTHGKEV